MRDCSATSLSADEMMEFSKAIWRELPRALEGIAPIVIQNWINNPAALAKALRSAFYSAPMTESSESLLALKKKYPLTVNRGLSFNKMIIAGHYQLMKREIAEEHFPRTGKGQAALEAVLVCCVHDVGHAFVLNWLERNGLRPGDFQELCAFGAQYPDLLREFSIAELATLWVSDESSFVAYVYSKYHGGLVMDLVQIEYGWDSGFHFLAFRK